MTDFTQRLFRACGSLLTGRVLFLARKRADSGLAEKSHEFAKLGVKRKIDARGTKFVGQ